MATFYLIAGALLMSAALVLAFRSSTPAVVAAYAGVWAMRASGYAPVSSQLLLFWAIAVLLVISIGMARDSRRAIPARARGFMVGGALAGMAAGLAFHQAGVILCSAAGVVLGALAFSGVSHMRDFRMLMRWIVAVGLPAVVAMTLVGIGVQGILLTRDIL